MADGMSEPATARVKRRFQLRPWIRAIHRDAGYFAVGLTLVYALSGLAVNHIADWDPSFTQLNRTHQLKAPLASEAEGCGKQVLAALGIKETPREVYAAGDDAVDIVADTYAIMLLYLAMSGLFMIPGRKGLLGRGAVIAALGAAVPISYVLLSGGPEAKNGSQNPASGGAEPKAR
jgi:hypothetical protein